MQKFFSNLTSGKRWLWIVAGLAVIGGVIFGVTRLNASNPRANAQTRAETTKVTSGDISGTVTASGHLQAHQDVSLSMEASGIVKEVNVKVGDKVKAGDVLVKLNDADAQRSVLMAQNALEEAKLQAQSAKVNYDSAAGWKPDDKQLAAAVAAANNAVAAVQAAQTNYDKVAYRPGVSATQQSMELAQATNNYVQAKADLDYLLTNRPELATPKINLDLASLQVNDAQFSLDAAQSNLGKLTLVAPFDGTITAVNVDPGEMASGPVVQIISADNLEGLLTVDEVDMASLDVKEPVSITLDTWPDTTLKGRVIAIDPTPTVGANADVINYGVHISIDKTDLPLRVGMTINATITTFNLKGVLLAPNGAVALENGKYYVNLVTGGQPKRTEVKIGVHNTQYTQILSGLKEGDEVQVNGLTAPVRSSGPGAFGGSPGAGSGRVIVGGQP